MARTENVFAQVEPEIKAQAEIVLRQLGIDMSSAVSLFLKQVILQRSIPFDTKLPERKCPDMSVLSKEQLDIEIQRGINSLENGNKRPAEDVHASIRALMRKELSL